MCWRLGGEGRRGGGGGGGVYSEFCLLHGLKQFLEVENFEFYCFLGFGKKVAILWVLAICRYFWGHFQN